MYLTIIAWEDVSASASLCVCLCCLVVLYENNFTTLRINYDESKTDEIFDTYTSEQTHVIFCEAYKNKPKFSGITLNFFHLNFYFCLSNEFLFIFQFFFSFCICSSFCDIERTAIWMRMSQPLV